MPAIHAAFRSNLWLSATLDLFGLARSWVHCQAPGTARGDNWQPAHPGPLGWSCRATGEAVPPKLKPFRARTANSPGYVGLLSLAGNFHLWPRLVSLLWLYISHPNLTDSLPLSKFFPLTTRYHSNTLHSFLAPFAHHIYQSHIPSLRLRSISSHLSTVARLSRLLRQNPSLTHKIRTRSHTRFSSSIPLAAIRDRHTAPSRAPSLRCCSTLSQHAFSIHIDLCLCRGKHKW